MSRERLLTLVFFVAGMPALMYQVIWQRVLTLYFGVDIYSTSVTVATFMLGLGAGSLAGGRLADRYRRPLALYLGCELAMGIFGFSSLPLFQAVGRILAGSSLAVMIPADFALMLPPTLLMGMTLPLMCRGIETSDEAIGRHFSRLYAVNTLGAAAGALLSSYLLIGLMGLTGATHAAAGLNLLLAGAVFFALRREPAAGRPPPAARPAVTAAPAGAARAPRAVILAAAFLSGFVALGYEIVAYRLLTCLLHGTVYVFGTILFFFLGGIAAGSWVARRRADRGDALARFGVAQLLLALYLLLFFALLGYASRLPGLRHVLGATSLITFHPAPELFAGVVTPVSLYSLLDIAFWAALFLGVPTFLMGYGFPQLLRAATATVGQLGRSVGSLYFANILGSTAGSLATGFVFLHLWGSEATLRILLVTGCLTALLALGAARRRGRTAGRPVPRSPWAWAAAATAVAGAALFPHAPRLLRAVHYADFPGVELRAAEDRSGVVVLRRQEEILTFPQEEKIVGVERLLIDGSAHGGFEPDEPAVVLDANVRLALSAHPAPRRLLSIGLGDGKMVAAAMAWEGVEELLVVELNGVLDEVLAATPQGRMLAASNKLRLVHDDGRRWLLAHPDERFDVVLLWPLHAAHAHGGNLFSREFFHLVAGHLEPGGLLYLRTADMYSTARTLATVFPHVLRIKKDRYVAGGAPFVLRPHRLDLDPATALLLLEADRELILAATAGAPLNRDLRPNPEYYLTYPYVGALQSWGDRTGTYAERDRERFRRWVAGAGATAP